MGSDKLRQNDINCSTKQNKSMRPQAVLSRRLAVEGMFQLMKEKRFDDISISEICDRGGISRQTFYRNFDTKEDVISYYVHHLVGRHLQQITADMDTDIRSFFENLPFPEYFLRFLYENQKMYLLRESILPLMEEFMSSSMSTSIPAGPEFDLYVGRFLADTMVSVLETWVIRDFKDSKTDLYMIMKGLIAGIGKQNPPSGSV